MTSFSDFGSPLDPPPVATKRRRSFFWPGFFLGLMVMVALSCGGLFTFLGFDRLSLADIQGSAPVWTPPAVTATPQPVAAADPAANTDSSTEGTFRIGDRVRNITNSRVNIRATPGHLGKPGDDVVAQAQPGDSVEILDGPQEADGLRWWRIRYTAADGRTIEGWMAEATSSGVVILGL